MFLSKTDSAPEVREMFKAQLEQREKPKKQEKRKPKHEETDKPKLENPKPTLTKKTKTKTPWD